MLTDNNTSAYAIAEISLFLICSRNCKSFALSSFCCHLIKFELELCVLNFANSTTTVRVAILSVCVS